LTTAKFKPLIFSTSSFTLSYTANMFIHTIPYDFCLFPAQFCYIIVYIWKVKSCVQIADRCAPSKIYTIPTELCPFLIASRHGQHKNIVRLRLRSCPLLWIVFTEPLPRKTAARITESTLILLSGACMLRALPSNGRCLQSRRLAMGLYSTISY
jgi:hypothetical protein